MKLLDDIVYEINCVLKESIRGTYKENGIVRQVDKDGQILNYDINENQIQFDDSYENLFYHKIVSEDFAVIKGQGKATSYNRTASMSLICYSRYRDFDDYLSSKLSKIKHLTIQNIDWDSVGIFNREIGNNNSYNTNHYVFSIQYQIVYKTNGCYEC